MHPRVAVHSPMSGSSFPAATMEAHGCGRETLIQPLRAVRLSKRVPGDQF
jgi:hypothetical protein